MEYIVRIPRPLPHQNTIIQDTHRYKFLVTGRRSGKTIALLHALLLGNSAHPGALLKKGRYWWVGPDLKQAKVARDFINEWFGPAIKYKALDGAFILPNGSEIVIKTGENEKALRGYALDGFIFDEVAHSKESVLMDCLMPSIKDRKGFGYLATTPLGFNWAADLWAKVEKNPAWLCFNCPSWLNPIMLREELELEKAYMSPNVWAAEYEGRFVAHKDALFNADWFTDILVPTIPASYFSSIVAVDLSLGKDIKSDFQALCFLGAQQDGTMFTDCRLHRLSMEQLIEEIAALYRQYRAKGVFMEANGFQQLAADAFIRKYPDIPVWCHTNTAPKETRIGCLSAPLCEKRLKVLDTQNGRTLVNQLRDFPLGRYDDGPDALSMAYSFIFQR